jgi:hypothetical protein
MRAQSFNCHLSRTTFFAFFATLLAATCLAQTGHRTSTAQQKSLKRFLQDDFKEPIAGEGKDTQYFPAFVDLKDDGTREVIVYLTGDDWCGSGGCTTLILAPKDSSYRVVTKITITRPPVRVLATKSRGWHDIAVRVQGGGIVQAYEAKLSFNGRFYPTNSSMPPARRLAENVAGEVVVPFTVQGSRLYP